MRETWKKQQNDPSYPYNTPLPQRKGIGPVAAETLATSLGDLPPKSLTEGPPAS